MSTIIYNNLLRLCHNNEAFFFKDFEKGNQRFRIFNYRKASYTDFLELDALECRGIMFEIDELSIPLRIASRPPEKFFNLNECYFTMDVDLSNPDVIMVKEDGSLISSYLYGENNDKLGLKTKGSISSDQAIAATKYLMDESNEELYELVYACTKSGYTVNMEWCSEENRIVLFYEFPQLRVLNARSNTTGTYMDFMLLEKIFGLSTVDYEKHSHHAETPEEFVAKIPDMVDIEGYVIRVPTKQFMSGYQFIKIKTNWYLTLHYNKDNVNSPRRLFECVLEEATDDLRSLFNDDTVVIKTIEEMELKVNSIYNHLVDTVENFYDQNKNLDRKSYAIKGQSHFSKRPEFGLAMNLYLGVENDYKAFLIKHYKEYGIIDKVDNDD